MLIQNYINEDTAKKLVDWIDPIYTPKSEVLFIPCTKYRNRKTVFDIPIEIYDIKNQIVSQFELEKFEETCDIFFNRLNKGQTVHKHVHIQHELGVDLRFNIMLQKSQVGGRPTCDSVSYDVNNGDLWIFNGNKNHETDLVEGEINRYIISYG
ncbi:MAG: hypothetical protein WCG45_03620, partial [bacterium]